MDPKKLVLENSKGKARDVAKKVNSGVVISADTVILVGEEIVGKPYTKEKAKGILKKMSGKTVEVLTGITVIDVDQEKELQGYEITKLKLKELNDDEINSYVDTGEPLDKAGAIAVQERGSIFIEKINGCWSNTVGLPLFKLNKILEELEISVFDYRE